MMASHRPNQSKEVDKEEEELCGRDRETKRERERERERERGRERRKIQYLILFKLSDNKISCSFIKS